jgi:ABC-type branched-subunit amino acid transport system substrate-binding protein
MDMKPRQLLMIRFLVGMSIIVLMSAMWGCADKPSRTSSQDPSATKIQIPGPTAQTAARVETLETKAIALMQSGELEAALHAYNQALALNPETPQKNRIMNGIDQVLAEMPSDLIQTFIETPDLAVPEPLLQYWLGVILAQETKYAKAVDVLTRFMDLWPDHSRVPEAQEWVAWIRQDRFKKDTIGCLLPLSGKYAIYGQKALKGIHLAIQDLAEAHNRKFNIVVKDTQGDPDIAAACVDELDQANVAGIIGPLLAADKAGARAQELKIPLIALTQKQDFALSGEYLFSNFITPGMQVQTLAAYVFRTLGLEKVAILYPDEPYGRRYMKLFSQAAAEYGADVVGMQTYDGKSNDFTEPVRKLIERLSQPSDSSGSVILEFEALFIPDSASRINMILPQLAFHDARGMVLLGTNLWHHPSLLDQTKRYNQNTIITDGYFEFSQKPATVRFTQRFSNLYGESPGLLEAIFYDTTRILISTAMDPLVNSRQDLKDALLEERIFEGATGRTLFNSNGTARKELFLITIKNDRFVELDR